MLAKKSKTMSMDIYTDNRMKRLGPTLLRVEIFSRPSELFYTWPIGVDNSLDKMKTKI